MWFMLQTAGAGGVAEDPSYGFLINKTNTALISEPEFPSSWHGLNSLWLAHIPNYWPNRLAYFKHMLRMIGMIDPVAYSKAVRRVRKDSYVGVDILAVAEAMEAKHPVELVNVTRVVVNPEDGTNTTLTALEAVARRRSKYPREPGRPGGRADDNWYDRRPGRLCL